MELPLPILKRSDLQHGEEYFIPVIDDYEGAQTMIWENDSYDDRTLQRFLVFKKREDAQKWTEEILKFIEGKILSLPHAEHL